MSSCNETKPPPSPTSNKVADYSIYVVTWNVGSRFPDNISLRTLLGLSHNNNKHDDTTDPATLPDIYAVGLQEVNSQPQNQVLGLFKEDPWTHKVIETLRGYDYVSIKTEQMQGLLLTIFVKRAHVPHLNDIEAEFTRTGFGGIWGNKGAVSVRLNMYGCGLVFVASHLAAHDQHLDERIEDYKQIMDKHHYHVKRFREIHDHDYVFWFGDLNFRLEGEDTPTEVRDAVASQHEDGGSYASLIKRDQLLLVRETKQEAFHLLHERLPAFPPTFKFKEGTSEYDLKRRPAWTDRILYAVQPLNREPNKPLAVEQRSYKSHPGYTISDHKPVTSEFTIKLFPNYRALGVVFANIAAWPIGQEYTVEYKKPLEFEERDHDWIGIYPADYTSFRDYVSYEYVNQADTPSSTDSPPMEDYFQSPDGRGGHDGTRRRHHSHNRNADGTRHKRLTRQRLANEETVRLEFCEDMPLKHGEQYLLIYFQNTGLRGVSSVSGLSNIFRAEKRSVD